MCKDVVLEIKKGGRHGVHDTGRWHVSTYTTHAIAYTLNTYETFYGRDAFAEASTRDAGCAHGLRGRQHGQLTTARSSRPFTRPVSGAHLRDDKCVPCSEYSRTNQRGPGKLSRNFIHFVHIFFPLPPGCHRSFPKPPVLHHSRPAL